MFCQLIILWAKYRVQVVISYLNFKRNILFIHFFYIFSHNWNLIHHICEYGDLLHVPVLLTINIRHDNITFLSPVNAFLKNTLDISIAEQWCVSNYYRYNWTFYKCSDMISIYLWVLLYLLLNTPLIFK